MPFVELKLLDNDELIAKAEYKKGYMVESFSHFVIRLEGELKMKDKDDWLRVVWKKEEDATWQNLIYEKTKKTDSQ